MKEMKKKMMTMMKMKETAGALAAMSGGVDSSVAALLAMELGCRCVG